MLELNKAINNIRTKKQWSRKNRFTENKKGDAAVQIPLVSQMIHPDWYLGS
jgi:hypothetical protein